MLSRGSKDLEKLCTDRATALYYKLRDDFARTLNEETCWISFSVIYWLH